MNRKWLAMGSVTAMVLGLLAACESTYKEAGGDPQAVENARTDLENRARGAIAEFERADPSISRFFGSAAGYAVFPKIAKGGAGLGGAHGEGVVFGSDRAVHGYATMSQGTIGLQLGGQTYRQVIFFQTPSALQNFKSGDFELSAQASAVAAREGAAKTADYSNGVAIFTMPREGLMAEASVGGQKFSYTPR
jgi:lipid-binding SYLF domain-containing protein